MGAYLSLTAYEVAGSVNIPNNTSQAYVALTITTNNGTYNELGTTTGYITINGSTISLNGKWVSKNTTTTLYSGTHTITHNSDGSKSIYIYASNFRVTSSTTASGVSKTLVLTTIPRASTVNGGSGLIGTTTTINLNRYYDAFTHTITYTFGSLSGTIATGLQANSVDWTIPTSFYAQIPNAKSGTGIISCQTFNDTTQIGETQTCTFTASVDENANKPTVSLSLQVLNPQASLTGDANKLIANYSNVKATGTATAKNSATITTHQLVNGDSTVADATTTFNAVTNGSFTYNAVDSRGLANSSTLTRSIVAYIKPTISMSVPVINATGTATFNVQGSIFNGSFGATSNSLTVQYRYKLDGGTYGSWTNATVTKSGNTYSGSVSHSGLDYTKAYIFQCRVVDSLNTTETNEIKVKSIPVFDWGQDDFQFHCDVDVAGELTVNGEPIDFNILQVYPIGSIYMSIENVSPSTLFGGGWTQLKDRFLLGAGDTYTAGSTGGEVTHTLTVDEMPSHNHTIRIQPYNSSSGVDYYTIANSRQGISQSVLGSSQTIGNTGNGQPHNNMPPYTVVYMWQRIS